MCLLSKIIYCNTYLVFIFIFYNNISGTGKSVFNKSSFYLDLCLLLKAIHVPLKIKSLLNSADDRRACIKQETLHTYIIFMKRFNFRDINIKFSIWHSPVIILNQRVMLATPPFYIYYYLCHYIENSVAR